MILSFLLDVGRYVQIFDILMLLNNQNQFFYEIQKLLNIFSGRDIYVWSFRNICMEISTLN